MKQINGRDRTLAGQRLYWGITYLTPAPKESR